MRRVSICRFLCHPLPFRADDSLQNSGHGFAGFGVNMPQQAQCFFPNFNRFCLSHGCHIMLLPTFVKGNLRVFCDFSRGFALWMGGCELFEKKYLTYFAKCKAVKT